MKQPELGKKITELRKSKGLTQEELVEKCNVSVRTIQRIEAGEVMPRSYTVKTILAALDYDLGSISLEEEPAETKTDSWINPGSPDLNTEATTRHLTMAWMFGIVYFVMGFFEGTAEYFRFEEDDMIFSTPVYITVKLAALISFVFFQRGFLVLSGLYNNYLLKIASVILIAMHVLLGVYDVLSLFYDSEERLVVIIGATVTYGAVGIVYGVALRRLERHVGRAAEVAGIFEIAAALFFVTVVFGFVGELILVPTELIEIIVLFKAVELMKTKSMQMA